MPKLRAKDFNLKTGNVSSVTVVMPPHETGDLLLVFAGKDDATGTDPTTATSGWTRGGSGVSGGATTAAVRAAWFYKVAASSAEPDLVITSSDADTWSIIAMSIQGAHATPIDTSSGNGNTDSTGAPFNVTGVTTNHNNSMVVYACFSGATGAPVPYPGLQLVDAVDTGAEGVGVAYTVQATAGATGGHDFYADATNVNCIGFCVAVRDDGNGYNAAYFDRDYGTMVHPFRGSSTIITGDAWGTALTNYPTLGKDAVDACFQVDQSGGPSYVDYTSAANNGTDADVTPYPATEAAGAEGTGDWFAVGYEKPFQSLVFDRAGCTQGVAGVVAWEYWNGSSWTALAGVTDATTSFTSTVADGQEVRWNMPANFNWQKTSINSSAQLYFVRARCTTVWTTNPTISQVYVGGRSLLYDAVAASADAGVNQFENAASFTPGQSSVQVGGTYIDLGQTVNLANRIVVSTFQFGLPRDYVDAARFKEGGGIHVFFADTSFNRKAWCVGSFLDQETTDSQRNLFAIDWEQTVDTTVARTTTDPSDTVADVFFGGLSPRGAGSFFVSHMIAYDPLNLVVNGGSSTNPITLDEFVALGAATTIPIFRDYRVIVPVTFGGSGASHVHLDGFTITFPHVASKWTTDIYEPKVYSQFHYDEGVLGFRLDARSGDTCKMTNGKLTSLSAWKFDVLSTASSGASWDFSGLLLENAIVTLRAVYTWFDVTFSGCTVTQNGATIDACFFVDTTVTSDGPADISDCDFSSSGTGHALELTTPGTYTFSGNTFAGYAGTNGSTGNEAVYNNSGGAVTLNIAGGGDTPSIRNGAGASTTVNNNRTVTLTGLKNPSEVRVFSAGTTTEISGTGAESVTDGDHAFSVPLGTDVDIVILALGYQNMRILAYSVDADATLPIAQQIDRQYANG